MSTPAPATTEWIPLWQLGPVAIPDPSSGKVQGAVLYWDVASGTWKARLLIDEDVDASAALSPAKLAGYPTDATRFLNGAGGWTALTSTWTKVATQTLGADAATIDFTAIPATYLDLLAVCSLRSTASALSCFGIRLNDDAGANYHYINATGGIAGTTGTSFPPVTNNLGGYPDARDVAAIFGAVEIAIRGYASTTKHKGLNWLSQSGSLASGYMQPLLSGAWASTSAVNKLSFVNITGAGNFKAGSSVALYGRT